MIGKAAMAVDSSNSLCYRFFSFCTSGSARHSRISVVVVLIIISSVELYINIPKIAIAEEYTSDDVPTQPRKPFNTKTPSEDNMTRRTSFKI